MNKFKLNYACAIANFAFSLDENKFQFDTDEEKSRGLTLVNAMQEYAEFLAGERANEIYSVEAAEAGMLELAKQIEGFNKLGCEGA